MNKTKTLIILILFVTVACGPSDKQAQLSRMEAQRDALNTKIEQLKAELGQESAANPTLESPAYVRIQAVQPGLFQHFIQVQGTVESDNNILIPAQNPGIVKKIHVQEGDRVQKDQLLAELDGAILESSIAELENALQLATTIYERRERLWDKNIGSEIEYLQAKNNKENLEKKLETLKEQYRMTKIYSPIGGTVDDVLIKEGEMAAAGRGTIRIVQLSRLKVTSWLSEIYIDRVRKNDMVQVQIPVLGRTFDHSINAVSQVIDPNNRTFQIKINVPSNQRDIKPNMHAVVIINDYTNANAITVPRNIVQETGTEEFLFVAIQENGQWIAHKRIVATGNNYDDRVEILSGLADGENVVTLGYQSLADGQQIVVSTSE